MAYKVTSKTATTWATAGSWDSVTNTPTIHASTNITLAPSGTIYSATFTAPNTTNACTGVVFHCVSVGSGAGTITVTLQENSVDTVATVTMNILDQSANSPTRLAFTTPYVFTSTTAGYYRFKIVRNATAGNNVTYVADSGAGNLLYLATDNRTGVPTAGSDFCYVTGYNTTPVTLTIDANTTCNPTGAEILTSPYIARSILGAINVSHYGILALKIDTTVTLTMNGNIYVYNRGTFQSGDGETALNSANTHTIIFQQDNTSTNHGLVVQDGGKCLFFGTPKTSTSLWKTTYVSGVGTNAVTPLIVANSVDWSVGDEIGVVPYPTDKSITPATIQGKTVSKFIKTKNSATSYALSDTLGGSEAALSAWATGAYDTTTRFINLTRNIIFNTDNANYPLMIVSRSAQPQANTVFSWCRIVGRFLSASSYTPNFEYSVFYKGKTTSGWSGQQITTRNTMTGITFWLPGILPISITGIAKHDFTDCFFINAGTYNGISLNAFDDTFTRVVAHGCVSGWSCILSNFLHTFTDCESQACTTGFESTVMVASTFTRFLLGNKGKNTTDFNTTGLTTGNFIAGTYGSTTVSGRVGTSYQTLNDGMIVNLYPVTTGNYETYTNKGYFQTNSGAMDQIFTQSTREHSTGYSIGTKVVTGVKILIGAVLQIANSAFYAGTHTKPYIQANYDLGTLSTAGVAGGNTSEQTITTIFTPTTDNSTVVATLSGKTDAGSTNGTVAWKSIFTNSRLYGYNFYSDRYVTIQTQTELVMTIPTPTTNAYITVSNPATVAGYGEFTINHGTQTVTITADTTLNRLYDYSQYNLTLDANMPYDEWFTTIDGVNYVSTYDIVLNTGVDLTGGGTVDVGSNTFTKTGTATYDGTIITSTNRTVHAIINGLVAGSTVRIYDTSNSIQLYNAVVAGTSLDYVYTYTGNINIIVDVKNYTYLPKQYSSVITNTGVTIPVSQSADSQITVTNPATVGAYTGISVNHGTQTVTITTNHTIKEIYDYAQWDLTQTANTGVAQWLSTGNGSDFTSLYNITVTNCNLTGGGTINVGAKTFTKTGTGAYDGTIITSTNRTVHISLTNLVSGSTVQLYNTTDGSEIYKAVVASTSLDSLFTWTTNKNIRIRVRKVGYIPYEATGTITNIGFSLNISQEVDSIYVTNAIDGSTVTEFSLSEGVVGIFIDDPNDVTSAQRMYNWYQYAIATTTFIDDQTNLITAQTPWSYILDDTIKLKNLDTTNDLYLTGANITNTTNDGKVRDTTGGDININGYFPFSSASDVGSAVWEDTSTYGTGTKGKKLADGTVVSDLDPLM